MKPFVYQSLPTRVVFAEGAIKQVAAETEALGMRAALVLCTPHQRELAEQVASMIGPRAAGVFDGAVMHVPQESVDAALAVVGELKVDGCVAVGGGSTLGLAKAIARATGLPVLAIPTTFAGSEMTPIYGITQGQRKTTGKDIRVLPRTVIYDPELLTTLPADIAGASGMNAIAHAVEALYAQDANPVVSLMAEESVRALAQALPKLVAAPGDVGLIGDALYGAWLAGICLGTVGMALHHKLCHTLGGTFNLPHAQMHAVMLPYSLAYNRDAAPEAMQRLACALGSSDPVLALYQLRERAMCPPSLAAIGMPADGLELAADLAVQNPYYNPRPVEKQALLELLTQAQHGAVPR
jgi:alcohol dehydrogenase class IV